MHPTAAWMTQAAWNLRPHRDTCSLRRSPIASPAWEFAATAGSAASSTNIRAPWTRVPVENYVRACQAHDDYLDIAVRQAEAQVPAHRPHDRLGRKPETGKSRS
jgi:hypothetical protein